MKKLFMYDQATINWNLANMFEFEDPNVANEIQWSKIDKSLRLGLKLQQFEPKSKEMFCRSGSRLLYFC